MIQFSDLGLHPDILKAVEEKGYKTPSPIQEKAIPVVLKGVDLLAAAQTGTGKTAGFVLPILNQIAQNPTQGHRNVRALILTPTRELAAQIQQNIVDYSKYLNIKSLVVFGGVGINPQKNKLKAGIDILVATPGRLLDLCEQRACRIDKLDVLVLDEADRMLDMGFIHDIKKVLKLVPEKRQTLLFSATFSKDIRNISRQFLYRPETVEVAAQNTTAERVKQVAYRCDAGSKADLAHHLIEKGEWNQVLIFTRTKHGANRLSEKLDKGGISSSAIHGNKSQGAREKALKGFKDKSVRVLVATDIAARGIDISDLPHVINYELPNVPEDYVHRIGRTGRAGKAGDAISLVGNDERSFLKDIEKLINQKIPLLTEEGFEPNLWPDRAPTVSEVMRADAERKKQNRQSRGPRNGGGRSKQPSKRRAGGSKPGGSESGGGNKPNNRGARPSRAPNRRRGGPR